MSYIQAGVVGCPIRHTLSPAIFSFLVKALRRPDLKYSKYEVAATEIHNFIDLVRSSEEFIGFNVTLPHKETLLSQMDSLTPAVQAIGALNVVQRSNEGHLIGHNTDVLGICRTLADRDCSVQGKRVVVLGAGGAARAAAYVLGTQQAGEVFFLHGNPGRMQSLVQDMSPRFPTTSFYTDSLPIQGREIDLVINALPLGMVGHPTSRDGAPAGAFFKRVFQEMGWQVSKDTLAFDMIYRPENTPFLQQAQEAGIRTMGGLSMLVDQALATWEIWMGSAEGLESLRPSLLQLLRNRPIFLTGFMGAGKSTVGPLLAQLCGRTFIDVDKEIETKAGMPIQDVFSRLGESRFRQIEKSVLSEHRSTPSTVIALGGGALLDQENLEWVQESGALVYLSANLSILLQRVSTQKNQVRPVLSKSQPKELFELRRSSYEKALFQVDTDRQTPHQIAQQLFELFRYDLG